MLDTNYHFGTAYVLSYQIKPSDERVEYQEIWKNSNGGVALVGLKAGQELTNHTAPFEVMVNVLEGEIDFTMNNYTTTMIGNNFILMGANVPHSVKANKDSKIMLVKIKE